ncbi:MAG: mannose-1-phosphate guanylyltransferase [Gemmatimonadetes bacterium]|nr:mannose-1-phosphate guanylyltransferase [Gemmatimonadota bacterium]
MTDPPLWITILAGGVGSRFWPVSTPARPKQLLPLASQEPLIVDTIQRARKLKSQGLRVLTGRTMVEPIQEATGLRNHEFLIEPQAKGTGPVLFWAAWELAKEDPDAVIVSLHSDHVIRPEPAFVGLLRTAAALAARDSLLLTVAVPPDRPETGYGYIRPGESVTAPEGYRAYRVDAFVEKPDRETARRYVDEGYRWNSGIFVWKARTFLDEALAHAPEIARGVDALERDGPEAFFAAVDNITVDEAVLERSRRVGSIDATFEWDDVGSWEALSRTRSQDSLGNTAHGDVHLVESSGNIAFADEGRLVLLGVRDLVVVQTGDLTVVLPRSEAPDLKRYLKALPESVVRPPTPGGDSG